MCQVNLNKIFRACIK